MVRRAERGESPPRELSRALVCFRPICADQRWRPHLRIKPPRRSLRVPLNQEPRTKNQEPRTKNQEPRTKNQEPRTKNQEPRTKNALSSLRSVRLKCPPPFRATSPPILSILFLIV